MEPVVEKKESMAYVDKEIQVSVLVSAQATQVERYRFETSQLVQCDAVITKNKSLQTEIHLEHTQTQTDTIPKPLEVVRSEVKDLEKEKLKQFFNMVFFKRYVDID